jgi:nucleoside 2-deoxyribosyltransferase
LNHNSIKLIAAELPLPKPHTKPDILLVSLSKKFPVPGQTIAFDWGKDYPLACARDVDELKFCVKALCERGFLEGMGDSISWAGWDRISQLESQPIISKYAFVAFQFSQDMLEMWQVGFGEAIKRAGFEPLVANSPEHNERIDAKIVAEIKRSRFLVADVTGAKTGVYFEAGYALGLGRPVIWTCHAARMEDMHFDTRQYNHILWDDAVDLQDQLFTRIVATI